MSAAIRLPAVRLDRVMQEDIAQAVVDTLLETFQIKCGLVSYHETKNYTSVGDISGIVGMVQKQAEGSIVISFTRPVLSNVLARVYGHEFETVSDLMKEGAAELTNMIYGKVKLKLNGRGHDLQIALPSVVVGPGHNINQGMMCVSGVFVFKFENKFTFEVVVAVNQESAK